MRCPQITHLVIIIIIIILSLHSNTEKKYNVHTLNCHGMGSSEVIQCAACKDKHRANVILYIRQPNFQGSTFIIPIAQTPMKFVRNKVMIDGWSINAVCMKRQMFGHITKIMQLWLYHISPKCLHTGIYDNITHFTD